MRYDYKNGCRPNDCYSPNCKCDFPPTAMEKLPTYEDLKAVIKSVITVTQTSEGWFIAEMAHTVAQGKTYEEAVLNILKCCKATINDIELQEDKLIAIGNKMLFALKEIEKLDECDHLSHKWWKQAEKVDNLRKEAIEEAEALKVFSRGKWEKINVPNQKMSALKQQLARLLQDIVSDDFPERLSQIRSEVKELFQTNPELDTKENRSYFKMI